MSELATFGAGCFWGVEEAFRGRPGVLATTVGYAGGDVAEPTYQQVCTDATGHAEVVQVEFDPDRISYQRLLDLFFSIHNPTLVNRQGADVGRQYRSVVFTHSPEQAAAAEAAKRRIDEAGFLPKPVATEITAAGPFWPAEEEHQQYFAKRGGGGCHV